MPRTATPFWDRVDRSSPDGCWPWLGCRNEDGYGEVRYQGEMDKAHRIAWILTYGPIPDGQQVLHSCDNPPCCKPTDLFLGSNHDNVLDRQVKGRSKNLFTSENHPATLRAGEAHWRAKLSSADVMRIRELHSSGLSQTHISAMFNVHSATISRIVRREWRKEVA